MIRDNLHSINEIWLRQPIGSTFYGSDMEIVAVGDFDGNGIDQFVLKSNSGIGVFTRKTPGNIDDLFLASFGDWMGNWHLGNEDKFIGTGNFNGSGGGRNS